jgi:lipopolysaccharide export system protein LptA
MTWLAVLLLCAQPAAADDGASHAGRAVVGGVVRSKEWVNRRAPHHEEEFVGDVSYTKGPSLLTSDWAIFRHEPQTWDARGHVRLKQLLGSGDRIEASGETAHYNQKTSHGWLLGPKGGRVSYSRIPLEGAPDLGSAKRLDWEGQERSRLTGQVRVWGPRLALWGDQADYEASDGKLTVTGGRPVVHVLQGDLRGDWTGAVQGDKVAAFDKPDRMQADGKTRGWIQFKEEPGKKVKKKK